MHWPVRYRPLVWIALVLGSSVATAAIGWSAAHAQLDPNVCFAVANTDDVLVSVNKTTGIETTIGLTTDATDTAISIEAIALPPAGSVLYAAAADRLGTLDRATGAFTALPNSFGTGDGFDGPVTFDDVKGLTFEPATGILYGSHRRLIEDDVLIQIDPASGARIPQAFGVGQDYVPISGCLDDIEDLAFDPLDGQLYAVSNTGEIFDELVSVDKTDGSCTSVGALQDPSAVGIDDMGGLSFDKSGQLYGTTGAGAGFDANKLWAIDKLTAVATEVGALGLDGYEAVACPMSGCELQFRIRHSGTEVLGSTIFYQLLWLNPCRGDASNVVITSVLPPGLSIRGVSASAAALVNGSTVTLFAGSLPKGPSGMATIKALIDPGLAAASVLENRATLTDAFGRQVAASDVLRPRANQRAGLFLTLTAPRKAVPGGTMTYLARYRGAAAGAALTLALPAGVTVLSTSLAPSRIATGTLTWLNLPVPSGLLVVKTRVDPQVSVPTILSVDATVTDGTGAAAAASRDTVASNGSSAASSRELTLSVVAPTAVRRGLTAQLLIRFRNLSGSGDLSVTLPAGLTAELTAPNAGLGVDGQLVWSGLPGPSGTVKIRALLNASAVPASVLSIAASLTDSGGHSASEVRSAIVRE